MLEEKEIIAIANDTIPSGPSRRTRCFESDAEEVVINNERLLLTVDEFSHEDLFRDSDAFSLGWNIAVGAISDILAAGGTPVCYSHAMVVGRKWDAVFIKKFCNGIAAVLKKTKATFAGGDVGVSDNWSYSASVIGRPGTKRITRKGATSGDSIYITGKVGAGNLEAGFRLYQDNAMISAMGKAVKNRFHFRMGESEVIGAYATSCIDTSDGVFSALNSISELNGVGYEVGNLPYIQKGIAACRLLSIPKTLLFLGECGEYELLFTVGKEHEKKLLKEAKEKGCVFYRIGAVTENPEIRILTEDKTRIKLNELKANARCYENMKDYLRSLILSLKTGK
jgi:thiamine-monophosphate kinase